MDDIQQNNQPNVQLNDQQDDQAQGLADTFSLFKNKLFTELKMNDLPEEERKGLEEKLENLINLRMINLLMIYMPEDKVGEFAKIIEEENVEKMLEVVNREIPNFGDLVSQELIGIRDEILTKYIDANKNG